MRKRLKLALLAATVAVIGSVLAAPAMAGEPNGTFSNAPDPQTANIPYLAWAGNQVRIAKCLGQQEMVNDHGIPLAEAQRLLTPGLILRASWTVEDWSGVDENNAGPAFLNAPNRDTIAYLDNLGRLCFSVHVSSLKPGMAVIKGAARIDIAGLTPGFDILGKHQFLVIWMQSHAPVIREVANDDFPDLDLGDPLGDGIFNPIFANGLVQINVQGTFPLGNDFAGIDPDDSVTLPDDWQWLAERFGVDDYAPTGGRPGSGAWRWDIHDDQSEASDHAGDNNCTPRAGTVDAVDNCLGGPEWGHFSHIFGFSSDQTVGPFDPVRDRDTFLGDGALNADDAPMPALRVDVYIAAGGIGSLEEADKDDIYVRDQSVPDSTPHNLYAPFYKAYIPAAGPSFAFSDRSGVAGAFVSNNFPGFQNDGKYNYYDIVGEWTEDPTRGQPAVCKDELGNPRPMVDGSDHVVVYTDEHGEAFVQYNPNTGFRFTADSNNRCDLSPGQLGTADITAEAFYPDQPVLWDQASKVSNEITKVVNSLASKTLSCVPKGFNESFCVETIRDIQGLPVAGALVRFSRTPLGNIEPDAALHGGFDTRGQTLVNNNGPLWVDIKTNALGQAGVVVTESLNICVDVKTDNLGTMWTNQNPGVKRFFLVNPTTGGTTTCSGSGAPGGGGGGNGNGNGNGNGTTPTTPTGSGNQPAAVAAAATVVSLAGAPTPAATPKAKAKAQALARLVSARLLVRQGNRYLVLRLKSPQKSAKVRIALVNRNGKVNRVIVRKIATNRAVTVPKLKFTKMVKSVRVSVVR